jgi:hypothetical protein
MEKALMRALPDAFVEFKQFIFFLKDTCHCGCFSSLQAKQNNPGNNVKSRHLDCLNY